MRVRPVAFIKEHFELFERYMRWRHPTTLSNQASMEDYKAFISGYQEAIFLELRLLSQLLGVAVIDVLDDALSAVYTFYAPDLPQRSLGTFSILWEIAEARRRKLNWLYLGYWITESRKMRYKSRFRPFEQLTSSGWQRIT